MIALTEVINALCVFGHDLILTLDKVLIQLEIFSNFNALNTHDAHEVIGRIAKFWASVLFSERSKIVNSKTSIVEVNDPSFC